LELDEAVEEFMASPVVIDVTPKKVNVTMPSMKGQNTRLVDTFSYDELLSIEVANGKAGISEASAVVQRKIADGTLVFAGRGMYRYKDANVVPLLPKRA
jgi:hypothetical protein